MRYLAADVGGTFTDLILMDTDRGRTVIDKVPSGGRGSATAIAAGIERIAQRAGCTPADIGLFVHGFTVPTNAFLMRKGARVALVTTRGFADVLEIGNQLRPKLYALVQQKPEPVVARGMAVEVNERIDAFGAVVEPLTEAEVARVVEATRALKPEAVAISLVFGHVNAAHEQALAQALREALPGVPVYASHVVNPQLEEWPRASTTAMAAYVGPVVVRYLAELEETLAGLGMRAPVRLMRSDGGVATPRAARENPGHMLTSGLAGGVVAGAELCRRLSVANAVTLDVGGTSADFSAIIRGEARDRVSRRLDGQPVRLPSIDVETISNGGGTIAWVDAGGGLRVGPLSAGAIPGPACCGAGGSDATVTDAAVVLGWLAPEDYLGGEVRLDPRLAEEAIGRAIARPLASTLEGAALGVIRVANAQLVQSIRKLCVERGLDIREMALIAFGGAGPLYGAMIARELGMAEVIVPRHPGVFAAEGLLAADIRHLAQVPYPFALERVAAANLKATLARLKESVDAELAADGVEPSRRRYRFLGDLRAIGQFHEIVMALPDYLAEAWEPAALARRFHEEHAAIYGHADPAAPVELVNLRMAGVGLIDRPAQAADNTTVTASSVGSAGTREVCLDSDRRQPVPIYRREVLTGGQQFTGPCIITQADSTTVVLAGQRVQVVQHGVLRIRDV